MATMIEDDVSLDNDYIEEGDDEGGESYNVLPNFMSAARDIMWRFPCRPQTAGVVTKVRAFRETFGTPLHNVERGVVPPQPGGTPAALRTPKSSALGAALSKSVPVAGPG